MQILLELWPKRIFSLFSLLWMEWVSRILCPPWHAADYFRDGSFWIVLVLTACCCCIETCWWKLNGDDIASIASRVAIAGRQSTATLAALGRWLNTNVASVNDFQLRLLLAAHGDFGIVPGISSFILPLEKYVSARVASMDRMTVAMCVDFFRRQRWLSTRVLDAVARQYHSVLCWNLSIIPRHRLQWSCVYTVHEIPWPNTTEGSLGGRHKNYCNIQHWAWAAHLCYSS